MEKRIKGSTKLLALFGSPVGHSGSPAMYNFSFRYHGLDYAYLAFDITKEQFPAAVDAVRLFQMRGFNVTMPDKNIAAELVDTLSPAARIIGAVNTVVNDDGHLTGYMTDGSGFVQNLKEHGVSVAGKKLVILGAGGAATAIQVECALQKAAAISIFNAPDPFLDRAKETAQKLKKEVPDCEVKVICLDEQDRLKEEIMTADILVNATRVGMKPDDHLSPITDVSVFRPELVVADTVYEPLETKMMKDAKAAGCKKIIDGEGMLLWQGAVAYKLYTGLDMPVDAYQKYKNGQEA